MTHILIVDHEVTHAHPLTQALKREGFEVTTQATGAEAHSFALQHRPDAIILCVELQGGSGYTVCNRLKKDEATRVIPLMLSSSEATQAVFDEHRRLRTHADAYLFKPYDPQRVHALLIEQLNLVQDGPQEADASGLQSYELSQQAPEHTVVNDVTFTGVEHEQKGDVPEESGPAQNEMFHGEDTKNDPLMSTDALLLLEGSVDVNQHTQVIRLPVGVRGDQAKDLIGEALADINNEEGAAWAAMQERVHTLEAQVRAHASALGALQTTVDALSQALDKTRAHTQHVMHSIGTALHNTIE